MIRSRPITLLAGAALIPLTALAAGCGDSGNSTAATTPPTTASGQAATVGVASTSLGNVLVNSQGRTLYLFKKDTGTKSTCTGACAAAWPPLQASGKPTVGSGASASMLATTKRSDGKTQVTYNGHPLYTFVMDKKAGDTSGQGVTAFGASWFALSSAGSQVSAQPSSSTGGGGGGY